MYQAAIAPLTERLNRLNCCFLKSSKIKERGATILGINVFIYKYFEPNLFYL